jgi:hypothetical protein
MRTKWNRTYGICIDGFMFMDVGIKVLFDHSPGDRECCSLQPNELIVSSCSLEPSELKELFNI